MNRRTLSLIAGLLFVATAPVAVAANTLVFAAASLTESLQAVGDAYAKTSGGAKPVFSFASSGALAKQIESGAPAQLFVSADEQWMDYVAERRLIDPATRVDFLGNRLVLVAPKGKSDGIKIATVAKALGDGKLSLADPDSVPAGKYGKAALDKLGLWAGVESKVVRSDNVRAALAFVERGEAVAGVVYATDAAASKSVVVVDTFPVDSHPPIIYPIAMISAHATPEAEKFRRFVLSDEAKEIFRGFGFVID